MIVKVQLPINSPRELPFVYGRDLYMPTLQRLPSIVSEALRGSRKGFFHATFNDDLREWEIGDLAPWQEW